MGSIDPHTDVGRRLLPHVIDQLAIDEPGRTLYEFPKNGITAHGFQKVSARDYANAINRASWWIEISLGRGVESETIGYQGPGDLRYLMLVIAAVKTGYKMLFTSPRNSVEGDIAVIQGAKCKTWLLPSKGSNISRVLDVLPMKVLDLPDLAYFLDSTPVEHYKYDKTWEVGRKDPIWVLHTSGSTGNPKPVIRYQQSTAIFGANRLCPLIDGRPLLLHDYFDNRVYITFPLFHAAGLNNCTLWPLFYGSTIVLGPEAPVTLEVMKEVIKVSKVPTVFSAPSILEDISLDQDFLSLLNSVKAVAYAGGPVSQEAGDRIAVHTKMVLSMGTTESGWHICVETDPEDWSYLHFHPNLGYELQYYSPGLYELVAVRKPELEKWQAIFSTFPDLEEYHFKDLFSKHPTKENLWHYEGRTDNILVLSNGEKFNPLSMETKLSSHPLVSSLLVAGHARFQISLLVEPVMPATTTEEKLQLIEQLSPLIEIANLEAPAHAQLSEDLVLIASPEKPFLKASKGTVRREPTLRLYHEEFEYLYSLADADKEFDPSAALNVSDSGALTVDIREVILNITKLQDFGNEDDFFAAGVDSLQVVTTQRRLQKGLNIGKLKHAINPAFIYQHPTINSLSSALWKIINGQEIEAKNHLDKIRSEVQHFIDGLPPKSKTAQKTRPQDGKYVVILTGSTGSLGSYLLNALMTSNSVAEVWCLNRSSNAESRQTTSSSQRGLLSNWKSHHVQFREVDLSASRFGLSQDDYDYLLQNATHILHTQWQVDFNLAVPSFSQHIRGVENIINVALAASHQVNIFFTSSIGVAYEWAASGAVPEKAISEYSAAKTGYGQSKLAAESLLFQASEKSGIVAKVCRVGQIAGSVNSGAGKGMWGRKEWFPSIIDISAYLSLLPSTLGKNHYIDWIPVDILAEIILELALDTASEGTSNIFHCVNPTQITWDTLFHTVKAHLSSSKNVTDVNSVPWSEWVGTLRRTVAAREASNDVSGLKLIDYFQNMDSNIGEKEEKYRAKFETSNTSVYSSTFRQLQPVSVQWMEIWLKQWGY